MSEGNMSDSEIDNKMDELDRTISEAEKELQETGAIPRKSSIKRTPPTDRFRRHSIATESPEEAGECNDVFEQQPKRKRDEDQALETATKKRDLPTLAVKLAEGSEELNAKIRAQEEAEKKKSN